MTNLNFENWIFEKLNPILHEMFLTLAENDKQPFLLNKDQWNMELKEPGKHVEPLLKRNDQGKIMVPGPQGNSLVPVHSMDWMAGKNRTDAAKDKISHFLRDQPMIAAFSQSSPENMASSIIFVLLTIRGSFQQVMQDFPLMMLILMGKFQGGMDEEGSELKNMIASLEGMLARKSPKAEQGPAEKGTRTIRKGYGTGTTVFGWDRPFNKFKGISVIWNGREKLYNTAMGFVAKKDTVGLFEYFLRNIPGLGAAKVGFVVQLLFGEMGCIDMHNINLYSQFYTNRDGMRKSPDKTYSPSHIDVSGQMTYNPETGEQKKYTGDAPQVRQPASARNVGMYDKLRKVMRSSMPSPNTANEKAIDAGYVRIIKNYMDVIEGLEKDGITTIKLWDYWVSYVAHIYAQPNKKSQPYATTGSMAGTTMNINDPADEKLLTTKDNIPDRNAIVTQSKKFLWVKDKDGNYKPYYKGKLLGKDQSDEEDYEDTGEKKDLSTYKFKGIEDEKGAGGASLAHHAVWWWRNKDYWYNLLKQAENSSEGKLEEPPEGQRYTAKPKNVTPSYLVAKPLAYLSLDVDLQHTIFPEEKERNEYMDRLDAALGHLGFFSKDNWLKKFKSSVKTADKDLEQQAKAELKG